MTSIARRLSLVAAMILSLVALPAGAQPSDGYPLDPEVAATPAVAPQLRIQGVGFGHGVGMSQVGAYLLGLRGSSAEEILAAYYTDLGLETRPDDVAVRVGLQRNVALSDLRTPDGPVTWMDCGSVALTDDVEDDDCGATAGLAQWTQPVTSTWVITATATGFALTGDGAPVGAVATDRLRVAHDGTTVSWPAVEDREYDHGSREFVRTTRAGAPALHVVQDLEVEDYLPGVAEVDYDWGVLAPATLEAQAIAARSFAWTAGQQRVRTDCACHLVAVSEDQVYRGDGQRAVPFHELWVDAVTATAGTVGTNDGTLVPLLYSASHAARSENIEDRPRTFNPNAAVQRVHRSRVDEASSDPAVARVNPERAWTATVDNDQLAELVTGVDVVTGIEVTATSAGGTPVELTVRGQDDDGQPVERTYRGDRGDGGDGVAGETLWRALRPVAVEDADGNERGARYDGRLPSAQIDRFGFATFTDDDGTVHEYATEFLAAAGIASGFGDGTFRPGTEVTRAQMATFLNRTFDLPDGAPSVGRFIDVGPDDVHAPGIHALAEAGITAGTAQPDRFAPGAPVSRGQMASFIARAAGFELTGTDDRFDDVDPDGPHAAAISALADRGITSGTTPGTYEPSASVTRGQMATFIRRVIEQLS